MTHNTSECHKYEKDGTLKKGFSRKAAIRQKCHGSGKKEKSNSFMQIIERFSKLEKTVKKAQKSMAYVEWGLPHQRKRQAPNKVLRIQQ